MLSFTSWNNGGFISSSWLDRFEITVLPFSYRLQYETTPEEQIQPSIWSQNTIIAWAIWAPVKREWSTKRAKVNQNGLAKLDSRNSSIIEQPVLATYIRIRFLCVKLHCEVDAFKSLVINYFSVWESAEWKTKWFDHERNKKADKNQDKVARIKKAVGYIVCYMIWP